MTSERLESAALSSSGLLYRLLIQLHKHAILLTSLPWDIPVVVWATPNINMIHICMIPNSTNQMTKWSKFSIHRLPFCYLHRLQLEWQTAAMSLKSLASVNWNWLEKTPINTPEDEEQRTPMTQQTHRGIVVVIHNKTLVKWRSFVADNLEIHQLCPY